MADADADQEPTDALKKRFARALYVSWWTDHMQDPSASYDHPINEDAREACESAADALLSIVAEEVRKAKAEALREAVRDMGEWADEGIVVVGENDEDSWAELTVGEWLIGRATEYEESP